MDNVVIWRVYDEIPFGTGLQEVNLELVLVSPVFEGGLESKLPELPSALVPAGEPLSKEGNKSGYASSHDGGNNGGCGGIELNSADARKAR